MSMHITACTFLSHSLISEYPSHTQQGFQMSYLFRIIWINFLGFLFKPDIDNTCSCHAMAVGLKYHNFMSHMQYVVLGALCLIYRHSFWSGAAWSHLVIWKSTLVKQTDPRHGITFRLFVFSSTHFYKALLVCWLVYQSDDQSGWLAD